MARRTKLDTKIIADYPVTLLERPAHSDAPGVHAHLVQFYEDDAFLLDELCPYIGSALGAGDSCVVIATEAHRTELARRLGEFGFDVAVAARQGLGIAPEQRQAVFDRFHQAHSEDHMSGIGLGLYITREIVELHGGSVRVEQPEHPGSRFVVTLPPTVGVA